MTAIQAFRDGNRRVKSAPGVLAGVFALTLVAALPLTLTVRQLLRDSLAGRMAAATASRGVDFGWWQEFSAAPPSVASSFSPSIIGGAAPLENLAGMVDNRAHILPIVMSGAAYVLAWLFLAGGILDRFARNRATGTVGFFAACGVFFFRFVRLAVFAVLVYGFMFLVLHPLMFGFLGATARQFTVERQGFALYSLVAAAFGVVLALVNLVFDYTKVRAVVEDRRSVMLATGAAIRFIAHHPAVVLLYLLNGCVFVAVVTLYVLAAPRATAPSWLVLVVGQLYVLARLWVKLLFYGSATAFFQGSFAHAGYLHKPIAKWPDSPAAEAIISSSDR